MKKPIVGIISAALLASIASAQTTINFNTVGQLTANFNSVGNSLLQNTTGGVSDSGSVTSVATAGSLGLIGTTGVTSAVGTTLTQSTSFKLSAIAPDNNGSNYTGLSIGFTRDSTQTGSYIYVYGEYQTSRTPDINVVYGGSTRQGLAGYPFTLTADSWYRFDYSMTVMSASGVGKWSVDVNLYSLGSSGTGTATLVGGGTYTLNGNGNQNELDYYNATTLYPYFGFFGFGNTSTITVDNFTYSTSAIPEPSTYAAMFGAAVLGLAMWRRRGRRAAA